MTTSHPSVPFPAQPSTDEAWAQFTAALADTLAVLEEDEFLVVAAKRGPYFVQFNARGAWGMRAEAIGNAYIEADPSGAPTVDDTASLLVGWRLPTYVPPDDDDGITGHDGEGSPNCFVDVAAPVDHAALAALAVRTLRELHRVAHPGMLCYSAFHADGARIRFPQLGIARE